MKGMTRSLIVIAGIAWCGCNSSSDRIDGTPDSSADSPADTAADDVTVDDTSTDDAVTDPDADGVPPARYVLHEWGVMVVDSDGATTHGPTPEYAGPIPAKPVIYLYAEDPMQIDIGIEFASGASTETWPAVALGPTVEWTDISVTQGACSTTPFPSAWSDPWTDGNCEACTLGTVVVPGADCLSTAGQVAKLLFYTGRLPGYEAPIAVAAGIIDVPGGRAVQFDLTSNHPTAVEDIWLVYRNTVDSCIDPSACGVVAADIAWERIATLGAGGTASVVAPIEHFEAQIDEYGFPIEGTLELPAGWLGLGADLEQVLIDRGLYEAEAGAFLNAWDTVYFGLMGSDATFIEPMYRNGASILYFMSREDYDAQLALEAVPSAAEAVRVGMVYQNI